MFTIFQIREAIGNQAVYARGWRYAQTGCVEKFCACVDAPCVRYTASVRGSHGMRYNVWFVYDAESEEFVESSCNCPAFERGEGPCKHVTALMLTALEREQTEHHIDALCQHSDAKERLWYERQAMWREQQERETREQYVRELVMQGMESRMRSAGQRAAVGDVRLYPILSMEDGSVELGLKVGRTRAYVVRSLAEFAERAENRTRAIYGKELTFAHSEEELAEQDVALFRYMVSLLSGMQLLHSVSSLPLHGAVLDQVMHLLVGRDVDVRLKGRMVRLPVREGSGDVTVALTQRGKDAVLRVTAAETAVGARGVYFFGEDAVYCAYGEAFERLHALVDVAQRYPRGLVLAGEQLDAVCTHVLAPAAAHVVMCEGEALAKAHTPTAMTPCYYVDMDEEGRLLCRVRFGYAGEELSPETERTNIRRDTLMERMALDTAAALFPVRVAAGEWAFEGDEEACFALLTQGLPALQEKGDVMISNRLQQRNVQKRRGMTIGLSVSGAELLLKADLGGFSPEVLREAYTAYRQKRKFVRLKDGSFLYGEALEQAAQAEQVLESVDMTAQEAELGASISKARAMYLEAALSERDAIALNAPGALKAWMERLRDAQNVRVEPPRALQAQLRGYQETGVSWLCALSEAGFGGILADDMGLGKTVQALAMLLHEQEQGRTVRALVVCPASLQLNWQQEAEHFAPTLRTRVLSGTAKQRQEQLTDVPELTIASYDQLRRDAPLYASIELTHVLLDEGQYIKNAASQAAKAVKTLHAQHRFAMTGTPIENRLSELWSIFDFLMPGYLFSYKRFKERFEALVVRDGDEEARANLRQMVAPFILRRMKQDVLTDLPEKVETIMTSEMTAEQQRLYAAHAARLVAEADGGLADAENRMRILAGLMRLRQICCDPRLCLEDYEGGSGKLVQCVDVVKNALAGGHRILLFSQFTSMLALLREALEAQGVTTYTLTGRTDKAERMRLVEAFNAGGAQVFLISLKAGGTGLNLTGADVVIHYDPWWNTSAQNQATDRAYRIGQTRGVQVIRLIASGTIEERILKLQEQKRVLSDGVLAGEENLFTVDADMIREILRG